MMKYHIKKDKDSKQIVYTESNKNSLKLKPKTNIANEDNITVDKMVIINESLVKKLVVRKLNINFKRLYVLLNDLYEEPSEEGSLMILDEARKQKQNAINKYKKYLEAEELETFIKKIEIIEKEVKDRLHSFLVDQYFDEMVNEPEEITLDSKPKRSR